MSNYNFIKDLRSVLKTAILVILFFTIPTGVISQNIQLNYKVLFNGNDIGWMRLEKKKIGDKMDLLLTSEVKAKIIFPITIFSKEMSTFENGRLIYSSQLRKTNGSTKFDKQTQLVGDQYEISENGEKSHFKSPAIDANLLSLYFHEPSTLKTVYWDKNNRFVKLSHTEDGGYQLKFSNGHSNCFYYKNGVCNKVKIEHLFYSAEIVFVH